MTECLCDEVVKFKLAGGCIGYLTVKMGNLVSLGAS